MIFCEGADGHFGAKGKDKREIRRTSVELLFGYPFFRATGDDGEDSDGTDSALSFRKVAPQT